MCCGCVAPRPEAPGQKQQATLKMMAMRSRLARDPLPSVATKSSRSRALAPAISAPKTKPQRMLDAQPVVHLFHGAEVAHKLPTQVADELIVTVEG